MTISIRLEVMLIAYTVTGLEEEIISFPCTEQCLWAFLSGCIQLHPDSPISQTVKPEAREASKCWQLLIKIIAESVHYELKAIYDEFY